MRATLKNSKKLAAEIDRWQKRLAPRLPDIDPHDLRLILWALSRRKYGGTYRFLLRKRTEGGYVF